MIRRLSTLAVRCMLRAEISSYSSIRQLYDHSNGPLNSIVRRSPVLSYNAALLHTFSSPDYVWHPAKQSSHSQQDSSRRPILAAVLVGWVGAEQRHLREFAEWYTSRGIHAITVSVPMRDLLSYCLGTRAQLKTKLLVQSLDQWLNEEQAIPGNRNLIFHVLCAGWLIYGFILDAILSHHQQLTGHIKGCIIDSSPLCKPDPQIWAKGFSIAILKRGSSYVAADQSGVKPLAIEPIIVGILHNFFSVFLNLPRTRRRLDYSIELLSKNQPPYPQLYLYSSGDRVLPAEWVKEFIAAQTRDGRQVSSHDFIWSPHVGHLRYQPDLYTNQLTGFINCFSYASHILTAQEAQSITKI